MFLGYAELFHEETHGFDLSSNRDIHQHYITILTIKNPIKYLKFIQFINCMNRDEYYRYICENNHSELYEHQEILFYSMMRTKLISVIKQHETIRNYLSIQDILLKQLHIFDKKVLETGESICILKTFWIKCIQRKWKKICQYNKKCIAQMKTLKYIKKKEYGHHKELLGIRGMWYSKINVI